MEVKDPSACDVQLKPRMNMTWLCEKHAEPIKFYCREHNTPLCQPGVVIGHDQKPCQLDNIEDVILEMRRKLEDKMEDLAEHSKFLKALDSKIQSCSSLMTKHLDTVNNQVNIAFEDKIKSIEDKELADILVTKEERDEGIRARRVKLGEAEAAKQRHKINEVRSKLLSEGNHIETALGEKIRVMKGNSQHNIDTFNNTCLKIERIKEDDKTLVNETPQVIASLDESVRENVRLDACLARIQRNVENVKFVDGVMGGKSYTRLSGYTGKWELDKSFQIPLIVNHPFLCGLVSNDEMCLVDRKKRDVFVSNINTGLTHKVIEGDTCHFVGSCAALDGNLIVCGKHKDDCMGDSLDGCITLYDRQWRVVRDITIPRNSPDPDTGVYVDVDGDGMILAGESNQPNIYIIDPDGDRIAQTITMQNKTVFGGIQALSSGDILVQTCYDRFKVISRSGERKASINSSSRVRVSCLVDKLTDTLYIPFKGIQGFWFYISAIDQVSCDDYVKTSNTIDINDTDRRPFYSSCLINHSGNLIIYTGGNIWVYKKTFLV